MKHDMVNAWRVMQSHETPSTRGTRHGRYILAVNYGNEYTPYVTAWQGGYAPSRDTSWSGGHYFASLDQALIDYERRRWAA